MVINNIDKKGQLDKKALVQRTVPKIDFAKLKKICRMKESDFHHFGQKVKTVGGDYYFKDNGADILFVAHLDSRNKYDGFDTLKINGETEIYCKTLDDRLGAYIGIDLLNKIPNINFDILLTTNEEVGASTAIHFSPPPNKKYKWIFSFDKANEGINMYQYKENIEARQAVIDSGLLPGFGTYSCIVDLEHLGVCGFNFGAGYRAHHTDRAHAILSLIKSQVQKFLYFYEQNSFNEFPYMRRINVLSKNGYARDKLNLEYFSKEELDFMYMNNIYDEMQEKGFFELNENMRFEYITPRNITTIIHTCIKDTKEAHNAPLIGPIKNINSGDIRGGTIIGTKSDCEVIKSVKNAEIVEYKKIEETTEKADIKTDTNKEAESTSKTSCLDCGKDIELVTIINNDEVSERSVFCSGCIDKHKSPFRKIRYKLKDKAPSIGSVAKFMKENISDNNIKSIVDILIDNNSMKRYWIGKNKFGPIYPMKNIKSVNSEIFMPSRVLAEYMDFIGIDLSKFLEKKAKFISKLENAKDAVYNNSEKLSLVLQYTNALYNITGEQGKRVYRDFMKSLLKEEQNKSEEKRTSLGAITIKSDHFFLEKKEHTNEYIWKERETEKTKSSKSIA